MPSRRIRWIAPFVLLVALIGAGFYWYAQQHVTPVKAGATAEGTASSSEPSAVVEAVQEADQPPVRQRFAKRMAPGPTPDSSAEADALPPMPPPDMPLAEAMEALKERAEAGEPEATCRLLLDVGACMERTNKRRMQEMLAERAANTDSELQRERMIDFIASSGDDSGGWTEFCADSGSLPFAEMERLLFQALPNMSNRQRLLFSMSREDGSLIRLPRTFQPNFSSGSDAGVISQFHADNDLDALEQGIAEADPLALEGKIILHMPMPMAKKMFDFREALPDPYRFAGYALMMQQLYGPESTGQLAGMALNPILQNMDPNDRTDLQQQVDAAVSRWQQVSLTHPKSMPNRDDAHSSSMCSD